MIQAIVDIYSDGAAAAVRAQRLKALDWHVVLSGPNAGTDLQEDGGPAKRYAQGWVVLASKTGISPVE